MLKNRAVRLLFLVTVLIGLFIFSATREPRRSSPPPAPPPIPQANAVKPPSPCLDALTWVKAAASTPTTEWSGIVDAVGINDIINSMLIVQVNSSWFATPRGVRVKYAMDIDQLVESHSKGCRVAFWDRKQNRVATVSSSGVELLTD